MKNKDELIAQIQDLGKAEDIETVRARLAELTNEVSAVYAESESLTQVKEQNENRIRQLESANMDLFLQVGSMKDDKEIKEDQTGIKEEDPPVKRKFEDLFDEKGGIK